MDDRQEMNGGETMAQTRENTRPQPGGLTVPTISARVDSPVEADLASLRNNHEIYQIDLSSHRRFLGTFIVAAKRIVKQLLTPSLERQSRYNVANNRVASHLCQQAEALQKISMELTKQVVAVAEEVRGVREGLTAQMGRGHQELAEQIGGIHEEQGAALQALRGELAEQMRGMRQELTEQVSGVRQEMTGQVRKVRQELAEQVSGVRQELVAQESAAHQELAAQESAAHQELAEQLEGARQELIEQVSGGYEERVVALQALQAQVIEQIAGVRQEQALALQAMRERSSRAERRLRRFLYAPTAGQNTDGQEIKRSLPDPKAVLRQNSEPDFDYFGFEERFRGGEEDIKERQRGYVEYFKDAGSVLDVGCGRGEFLELLAEAGIKAQGVDLDLDMVLYCQEKGLDVVREDVYTYLESLPDESLGGVFAAQLVEHLESNRIIELVNLCQRKLRAGGVLIFETPNPLCLTVFSRSFYMDFSHIRPIHPEALKFLFESAGFENPQARFSSPVEACMRIPPLSGVTADAQGVEEFNKGIERLNDLLYGCQDYAVIGKKSSHV
jgi:2-polyprenyl-3-methyl-5-hydroxy-6-metoxy-1,4-benzoquinol methylase